MEILTTNSIIMKPISLTLLFGSILVWVSTTAFSFLPNNPDAIVGDWKTGEGTAVVRIYKNGNKYQGKIIWLKEPNDPATGQPRVDRNHPDESSRNRPLIGLVNLWGFNYSKENNWEDGKIYDPKNGKTYSCKIKMTNPNSLEVRGFIGVSLIGRTDMWTRQVLQ